MMFATFPSAHASASGIAGRAATVASFRLLPTCCTSSGPTISTAPASSTSISSAGGPGGIPGCGGSTKKATTPSGPNSATKTASRGGALGCGAAAGGAGAGAASAAPPAEATLPWGSAADCAARLARDRGRPPQHRRRSEVCSALPPLQATVALL